MYAVIRLRGNPGAREEVLDTLQMLNLKDKFNCTLVPENESYEGMLKKVKNFVTWGEVEQVVLEKLLDRVEGYQNSDSSKTAGKLLNGGETLKEMKADPVISLTPPSGGFKGPLKKIYPDGEAGYRGKEINKLLERML
ncbi:hypothetical protein AKJ51_04555 [candidate division MSBL1 archaeon SCGC-AAA382A20]|uniref:Large ribosomal subunit protein uL30-like ferredoxin-like fold domain-containing protein n=1 Tax=candidate division MSBL1 archaeon SCGC-AAA382A20 TaxID=1698280 RepID=A0A133VHH4_9EURY|nr:hypothetical protein AKJ51_04555 [candidate division MSBL1 archaeon SCGC-AAA382A20]